MAEAFFNKFSKKNCAKGRGISPYTRLNSNYKGIKGTVTVMKEEGLAVSSKLGIPVTKKNVGEADRIIVLLDKSQRQILPKYITSSSKTRYQGMPDSDARSTSFLDQQRRNRDRVKKIVNKLVREIG